PHTRTPLIPYTTLFRSCIVLTVLIRRIDLVLDRLPLLDRIGMAQLRLMPALGAGRIFIRIAGRLRGRVEQRTLRHRQGAPVVGRSEEHTSELQSREKLV